MTRAATPLSCTVTSRRRCSMARKRASMREGPLAELFRATEAAQRQAEEAGGEGRGEPAATAGGGAGGMGGGSRAAPRGPEPWRPAPEREVELPPAAVAPTAPPVTEAPSW